MSLVQSEFHHGGRTFLIVVQAQPVYRRNEVPRTCITVAIRELVARGDKQVLLSYAIGGWDEGQQAVMGLRVLDCAPLAAPGLAEAATRALHTTRTDASWLKTWRPPRLGQFGIEHDEEGRCQAVRYGGCDG